ncbi:MAG: phage minor capsid protein [Brachybacterium sp.]|uniref:phage minor capsid protein n=1 Tax=Brachybacterium sp. TaxID=1891286 RepID=UPI0026477DD1|nr:phage minor capsid protein [Brachybacterium sp.]MDN5687014.1 phage minor capsid protein [Brachybacterium sp.]
MTISPDYSRQVARKVRAYYQEAEEATLARIIRAVSKGLDSPDWAARKAGDLDKVLRVIGQHLDRLDEASPGLITRAVAEAYQAGTGAADVDMRAAGLDAIGGTRGNRAVDVLAEDTVRALSGTRPRVLREVSDVYQRITADTAAQVLTGAQTRREAARDAVRRYTLDGIAPFTDTSGRRWDMASYAEMATRTTAGHAAVEGHTDRLQALGQDLVIVSSSPESCDLCGPWEGEVLSISGATTGRLSDGTRVRGTVARARGAGLQHPNCTHTVDLYLPGITDKPTIKRDPDGHETRQRQRAYERSVRRHKRAVLADEELLGRDSPQAIKSRQKLRNRQAEFSAWRDANDRKPLSYRTSLTAR